MKDELDTHSRGMDSKFDSGEEAIDAYSTNTKVEVVNAADEVDLESETDEYNQLSVNKDQSISTAVVESQMKSPATGYTDEFVFFDVETTGFANGNGDYRDLGIND